MMKFVQTAFARPWDIRVPILTRYMGQEFVEDFFNYGKIRLSSFKYFRKNPDEQQGDPHEGRTAMRITASGMNHSVAYENGQESYILCTSTVENKNMKATFKTNHGFRILNPLAFADAISRHIPGFVSGMEGLCSYRENLFIEKHSDASINPPDNFKDPAAWEKTMKECNQFITDQMKETFFIKKLKFSHQGEYRFIWFASGIIEKDYIDIECPEAIKFCQRLT